MDKNKICEAILKFPPFAGLDHERVIRQKTRIGRLIGIGKSEVINILLKNPVLASCSYKRDLAVLDVMRKLAMETQLPFDKDMLNIWLKNYANSPYVPNTNRKRISQVKDKTAQDPKLLKVLRKKVKR